MSPEVIPLVHIFIDHSNIWGGCRLATKMKNPEIPDKFARISVRNLNRVLVGKGVGVTTKLVSGGIPPGMEGVWSEYQHVGFDTQRLFRDENWKECGVDHTIIGHMWRLLAQHRDHPTIMVLASGDGKLNEFKTSFIEVLEEVLKNESYDNWKVRLASFDWPYPNPLNITSPTKQKMKKLVTDSPRGEFINLFDHYDTIVYHDR